MRLVPFATRHAPTGMVCAVDQLAAEAGVAMLRSGGTAADAAVAASAVLAVTTQQACGMGGDLFALVHHGEPEPACLNASGRAGSGADPDRLRAEGPTAMPFRGDIRSVPVPGCVDGWLALHDRFGSLPLAGVLAPAIGYAEGGFPASSVLCQAVRLLDGVEHADDYTAGGPLRPGQLVRRPGVARALRDTAAGGRGGFYEGEFGRGLLELGAASGGRPEYTDADLSRPLADWVSPIAVDVWGRRLWTVPPNSQGYITASAAWVAAQHDLPDDPDDPAWPHLLVEAARQASFDRGSVLHEGADGAALVAPDRLAPRASAVDTERAALLPVSPAPGGTIYLAAVDGRRMGVSLIQSNAAGFGALLVVPGVRIFLQNRGIGFSLEPGHPAEYGPGRRPPHTLAPALLTHSDGTLAGVLGTEGGDTQPQVLLQLLARMLVHGEDPGDALAAARWALQAADVRFGTWEAGGAVRVRLEGAAPPSWAEGLRRRGHDVETTGPHLGFGFGHAQVILVDGEVLAGAADPRARIGAAAGY